jgi:hypothetical protein
LAELKQRLRKYRIKSVRVGRAAVQQPAVFEKFKQQSPQCVTGVPVLGEVHSAGSSLTSWRSVVRVHGRNLSDKSVGSREADHARSHEPCRKSTILAPHGIAEPR